MVLRQHRALIAGTVSFLVLLLWVSVAYGMPSAARPTPHPIEGREDCVVCHGIGKAKPYPADHEGRASATCVACHPVQSAPAPPAASPAPPAPAGKNDACLSCHSNRDLALAFADGSKVSAHVDAAAYAASVHGSKDLACVDCHTTITAYPHPERRFQTRRDYSLAMDETCQKCHSANYSKAKDGVHAKILAEGNKLAPGCTDCHGVHAITSPDHKEQPSKTCAKCHDSIYRDYAISVHGAALVTERNPDVPTCTTCHGVHNMPDARTAEFHVGSPDLCAKCHSDEALMAKYGLSSRVVQTYRQEFHGVTTEIYKTRYPTVWCYKAVCTDCHGVHDIRQSDDPASSVHKINLPTTCGKCHEGASESFASAWIGHYEPSPQNSPLVYYVNLFYQILIPVMVVSLLAFIALDVFRRVLNHLQAR